jgi:hypothetical protein
LPKVHVTDSVLVTLMFDTGEPSEQLEVKVHPGGTSSLSEYPEPAGTLNVRWAAAAPDTFSFSPKAVGVSPPPAVKKNDFSVFGAASSFTVIVAAPAVPVAISPTAAKAPITANARVRRDIAFVP